MGGMLLSVMLVHVLAAYTAVPLWGCYGVVGSVLAVLGWVLLASGRHTVEEIDRAASDRGDHAGEWAMAQRSR